MTKIIFKKLKKYYFNTFLNKKNNRHHTLKFQAPTNSLYPLSLRGSNGFYYYHHHKVTFTLFE